uniref:C3H1-type domain-containing protein n=1 Tax=Leersia perrieri TaxID=77586 RepID=A0A0D9W8E7_9ORYZ
MSDARMRKPCVYFSSGDCRYGDKCRFLHADSISINKSFSLRSTLHGHQMVHPPTPACPQPDLSEVFVGCDWDCAAIRNGIWCSLAARTERGHQHWAGGRCILSEGPMLFVGIPGAVKIWNTQTGVEMNLIHALAFGNGMLFAAIQDGKILAWRYCAEKNSFDLAASLVGHQGPVVSLSVGTMRLYSGAIMSLLCWEQFLLSCSLDQTIKVWTVTETGSLAVTYTHNEDHGALALAGMQDAQLNPIFLCSTNDKAIHLYELPSFIERDKLSFKVEIRAMKNGPGRLIFTGDEIGELMVSRLETAHLNL